MAAIVQRDIFKCIFSYQIFCTLNKISQKFVPDGPIASKDK